MSTELFILLSVVEAVLLVLVLAVALIQIQRRLTRISNGLDTLGSELVTVESQHLRPLDPLLKAINERLQVIVNMLQPIARKAAIVRDHARAAR